MYRGMPTGGSCLVYNHENRIMYTPLNPNFIYSKTGVCRGRVYLFFLFLLQNIDCGYSLEPPRIRTANHIGIEPPHRGGSAENCTCIVECRREYPVLYTITKTVYCIPSRKPCNVYLFEPHFYKNWDVQGYTYFSYF